METGVSQDSTAVPAVSFSIVIETENLALEGPEALIRCLGSLRRQSLDIWSASEVVITNSGEVPPDIMASLKADFPNLLFKDVPEDTGYYEAKMLGAALATGDIVMFCDSDLEYNPGWLEAMLEPFTRNRDIQFVSGETSYDVKGPYGLALLLTFFFPPFSGGAELSQRRGYAANNFAMRRDLLERHPIPTGLGLYRGNCQMHAEELRLAGIPNWGQPKGRAFHPLLLPSRFLQRFFLAGHHAWMAHLYGEDLAQAGGAGTRLWKHVWKAIRLSGRAAILPIYRLPAALRGHPGRLVMLPLALPIVLAVTVAYIAGLAVTIVRPSLDFSGWAYSMEKVAR